MANPYVIRIRSQTVQIPNPHSLASPGTDPSHGVIVSRRDAETQMRRGDRLTRLTRLDRLARASSASFSLGAFLMGLARAFSQSSLSIQSRPFFSGSNKLCALCVLCGRISPPNPLILKIEDRRLKILLPIPHEIPVAVRGENMI